MQKFKIIGKPLLGEKYAEGKKEEEGRRRIMPSLVATTSASTRTMFVRTHSARTNYLHKLKQVAVNKAGGICCGVILAIYFLILRNLTLKSSLLHISSFLSVNL